MSSISETWYKRLTLNISDLNFSGFILLIIYYLKIQTIFIIDFH
nr:MAG TPA: hypothetical protein [Caudoviricetes sp.]